MASIETTSPGLGPVASSRARALYVVKVGSSSQAYEEVFAGIAALNARGARVLLIAGGADGIVEHYEAIGRAIRSLHLTDGREVRHVPEEELPYILDAYHRVTLPRVVRGLRKHGLRIHASTGEQDRLVTARLNAPLRAVINGRPVIVRDHRAGTVTEAATDTINSLLDAFDVLVIAPPVADEDGGAPINIDADVLAAELANRLEADHLRLVTSTPGILTDVTSLDSTIPHLWPGEGYGPAQGRMLQKVRAAEIALRGSSDVAICGPHRLTPATRFWRQKAPHPHAELLSQAVEISSVSGDEHELGEHLRAWATAHGLDASIDLAGNLLATKGDGARRLLLLGHLDTVPHRWAARWEAGQLHARGAVDAKGSLIAFLETLAQTHVPSGTQVQVVGAVQEENTAAGTLHFARTQPPADAVIVGEPSGTHALTIGYHGLVKLRLLFTIPAGHTAGRGVRTAADIAVETLTCIHQAIHDASPGSLTATLGLEARNHFDAQLAEAVVDVRVAPGTDPELIISAAEATLPDGAHLEVLRATPAMATARTSDLVKSFSRAFRSAGIAPRFLAKKGSSDMNTLAAAWGDHIPMVAYGPGDASLDHSPVEHLELRDYLRSVDILSHAVRLWIESGNSQADPGCLQPTG